jgi:2-phosphosulfolactate phosphatase
MGKLAIALLQTIALPGFSSLNCHPQPQLHPAVNDLFNSSRSNMPHPGTPDSSPLDPSDLDQLLKIPAKRIDVAFLPHQVEPEDLRERTVIVTDVLRATTTVIAAMAHGCQRVLPQPSVESARDCHSRHPQAILGGERRGQIIPGFHQGNSPVEYRPENIAGKTLILATTNGTVAMERCRLAQRTLIGAMINLTAVAQQIPQHESVTVICSGTDGEFTSEDILFAGALIEKLIPDGQLQACLERHNQLSDRGLIALHHWLSVKRAIQEGQSLVDFFRLARGGVNLVKIGLIHDLVFAANIDSHQNVPRLNVPDWAIE